MTLGPQFAEQLPLFMSAQQIKSRFNPLPADFQDAMDPNTGSWLGRDETRRELWKRKLEESKLPRAEWDQEQGRDMPDFESSKTPPVQKTGESTSSFGSRENAWFASRDWSYRDKVDDYLNEGSMHDSIRAEGVQNPVHLGFEEPESRNSARTILGGHHRIAASADIDPNRLMPVLFHHGTTPAHAGKPVWNPITNVRTKIDTGYDYT